MPTLHYARPATLTVLSIVPVMSLLTAPASIIHADEAPANSTLALSETFDGPLDSQWKINTGDWKVEDGVLIAREVKADQHSAAARRILETGNAVYELNFQLTDNAKAFHLGFDPKKGTLDKKGHLFSVIVTPTSWKILKHVDKARPKDAPNETLATAEHRFEPGRWYRLRVTTWENYVTAKIDSKQTLKASDPSFRVKKPTLVFRCQGDGVQIDDLRVWTQAGQ
ncbi:MAG: hypothetical protein NXI04_11405 [Planctomycetaceae bacterium]|nr:hypothetical protein [Planctomycetaceae bacterium]